MGCFQCKSNLRINRLKDLQEVEEEEIFDVSLPPDVEEEVEENKEIFEV